MNKNAIDLFAFYEKNMKLPISRQSFCKYYEKDKEKRQKH